jgi:hypothetical protein
VRGEIATTPTQRLVYGFEVNGFDESSCGLVYDDASFAGRESGTTSCELGRSYTLAILRQRSTYGGKQCNQRRQTHPC